jgi:hypothetical protein
MTFKLVNTTEGVSLEDQITST